MNKNLFFTVLLSFSFIQNTFAATLKNQYDLDFPLHSAVKNGDLEAVKQIVNSYLCSKYFSRYQSIDTHNLEGKTALHIAAEEGHLDIVKYLVLPRNINKKRCCCPNLRSCINRLNNILHNKDNIRIIEVDCQETDSTETPLHCAIEKGHFEVVKFLVLQGASVNLVRKRLAPAEAFQDGILEAIQASRYQDPDAASPLSIALENNHQDIAQFLIQHGAKIGVKEQELLTKTNS